MKFGVVLGVVGAVLLHAGFILFGGLLIPKAKADHGTLQQVELLEPESPDKPKDEQPKEQDPEEIKADDEPPPDAADIVKNMETPAMNEAPALDAASLSAIENALNGVTGGGDFGDSVDLHGGGVIGGT